MKMLTARVPQDLLRELTTACSSKISHYHWSIHFLFWWRSKDTWTWTTVFKPSKYLRFALRTRMDREQSNFNLFLFLFWFYHLLLHQTKLFLFHTWYPCKIIMALRSKYDIFLFLFVEIFFRTFVYNKNTLEGLSNTIKFEMQIEYFKSVFIVLVLFSKNGVKNRLKGIFQT